MFQLTEWAIIYWTWIKNKISYKNVRKKSQMSDNY